MLASFENRQREAQCSAPEPFFQASIYPHILRRILEFCPSSTLSAASRTSNESFRAVIPVLYRRLCLSESQWWALLSIAIGKPMYDTRLTATIEDCSYTMRRALGHVRHLTITSFWSGQLPQLPSGLLPRLQTLELVAPTYGNKPFDYATLGPYPARHLIIGASIRTPPSVLLSQYTTHLNLILDKFTLLIPPRVPFDIQEDIACHGKAEDTIELVFLPIPSHSRHIYDETWDSNIIDQLSRWERATPAAIHVFGLEDTLGAERAGVLQKSYRRKRAEMSHRTGLGDDIGRLCFATYAAWLDAR